MRLLDNYGQPTTVIGWLMGSERGSFALLVATALAVVGLLLAGCSPIGAVLPSAGRESGVVSAGGQNG